MGNLLFSITGLIITIFFVVGIHEFGHFIIARLFKIKILRFSIGFGKVLFKWQDKHGTEFAVSAIPLGGYVKMLDENEQSVSPEDIHLTYNHQPYLKKLAVIAAGPIFNLLFAFIIYWSLFIIGFVSVVPMIGKIIPHSIAADAGLSSNEEIIQLENTKTNSWVAVIVELFSHAGNQDSLTLITQSPSLQTQTYKLNLKNWHMDDLKPDPLLSLGITPFEPFIPPIVGSIATNSPAANSGLQVRDEIIKINGISIKNWMDVSKVAYENPDKKLLFQIKRDKKLKEITVLIGSKRNFLFEKNGYLGISPDFIFPQNLLHENKYKPTLAAIKALQEVNTFVKLNFIMLKKILTGKVSLKSLGGPITIFQSAGASLNNGMIAFLSFLAFLSISIGIINIIPVPGLDGGHILFETIEWITRKPLNENVKILFYRLGAILLILVMIQSLTNDLLRF